jgi:ketosteroid isomerase-like protein
MSTDSHYAVFVTQECQMTTSSLSLADPRIATIAPADWKKERNRQTIQGLVDGFSTQDIEGIMAHFADDAVYCDILGKGLRGDEYHGKAAIRQAIVRQFDLSGQHTFVDAKIMIEGDVAFASWTMLIGDPADPSAARFEGIDEFAFDLDGQVTLKKAWLKGQPRLRRTLLAHNPAALFRHLGYSLKSWGR